MKIEINVHEDGVEIIRKRLIAGGNTGTDEEVRAALIDLATGGIEDELDTENVDNKGQLLALKPSYPMPALSILVFDRATADALLVEFEHQDGEQFEYELTVVPAVKGGRYLFAAVQREDGKAAVQHIELCKHIWNVLMNDNVSGEGDPQ